MSKQSKLHTPPPYSIPLTQGKVALVSRQDYYRLRQYRWVAIWNGRRWYAGRSQQYRFFYMHREILGLRHGDRRQGDHRDGNGLDNRRGNLRIATAIQNSRHQRLAGHNTSGFKGVTWHKCNRKWQAQIKHNNKLVYLGNFHLPSDAAKAYDKAAKKLHGRFAKLNFPR